MPTFLLTNSNIITQSMGMVIKDNGVPGSCVLAQADIKANTEKIFGVRLSDVLPSASGGFAALNAGAIVRLDAVASVGNPIYLSATNAGQGTSTEPALSILLGICANAYLQGGVWYANIVPQQENAVPSDVAAALAPMFTAESDPTGWDDWQNISVAYDSTARQITISRISGNLKYWWRGVLTDLGATSVTFAAVHANSPGIYYLFSSDGINFTWSSSAWAFSDLMVAIANFTTIANSIGLRETHGLMGWTTHRDLHLRAGTGRDITTPTGGTLNTYVLNSSAVGDRRPGASAVNLLDEDLTTNVAALVAGGPYAHLNLTSGTVMAFVSGEADIIHNSGSVPQWQSKTTAVYSNIGNNNYANIWLIALPATTDANSQSYRWMFIQAQAVFSTLNASRVETFGSLNLANLASQFPEFLPVARIAMTAISGVLAIAEITFLANSLATQVSAGASSQSGRSLVLTGYSSPGAGNHTTTSGTSKVRVFLVGSGGGGGGATYGGAGQQAWGGGGGGGGWIMVERAVTPGAIIPFQLAGGGPGGAAGLPGSTATNAFVTIGGTTYYAGAGIGGSPMIGGTTPLFALGGLGAGNIASVPPETMDGKAGGCPGTNGIRLSGTVGVAGNGGPSTMGGTAQGKSTTGGSTTANSLGCGGSGGSAVSADSDGAQGLGSYLLIEEFS